MSQTTSFQVYQPYSQPNPDVALLLNMTAFGNNTVPSLTQVQDLILRTDSYIDRVTANQFRLNMVQDERYDLTGIGPRAGRIVIRKSPVVSIQRVQWYDGTTWHDAVQADPQDPFVIAKNLESFFFYPEKNAIEFYRLRTTQRRQGVRMSYTWGRTLAPDYIRDLSSSMAAYQVMQVWAGQFNVAEDASSWKRDMRAKINTLLYLAGGIKATGWTG